MKLKDMYKISRPRFWLYYAGTYAVGVSLAATTLNDFTPLFFAFLLFFTFPANFFIYGINDYFDWETDKLNPKKKEKEYLLKPGNKKFLRTALIIPVLLGLLLTAFMPSLFWFMLAYLAIGGFYSAPPLRFKARPFLDSLSNMFYVIPGFMGYYQVTGTLPSLWISLGVLLWPVAMHLYSAVPDIKPDSRAKIKTTATALGRKASLYVCATIWTFVSIVAFSQSWFLGIISLVYPIIALGSFKNIEKIYWAYPYINAACGGILFWYGVISGIF